MSPLEQQIAAYAVVAAAIGWLVQRWFRRRRDRACVGCGARRSQTPARAVRPASLRVLR